MTMSTTASFGSIGLESLRELLLQAIQWRPALTVLVTAYFFLGLACFALLFLRPMWLLVINDGLKSLKLFRLPDWLGGIEIPIRYLLLVGFFHYRMRVLDAWVSAHVEVARRRFEDIETVRNRLVHITVPVILDANNIPRLGGKMLRPIFDHRGCLLICGEGGSGKTSLACQIARWAMLDAPDERLSDHLMLPVLIEQELDFEVPEGKGHLREAIRGKLEDLLGEAEPLSDELLERLLRYRRILVIVDQFSEMSEQTQKRIQPQLGGFAVHALAVTSRTEKILEGSSKTMIRTLRVEGNRLSSFIERYLQALGKRDLFDDPEYFDACRRLSMMVGERRITVLLAKLYAEQMIASKEDAAEGRLPENIPDLMLSYVNELNRRAQKGEPDDRTIHEAARIVAWECVRKAYRPARAKHEDVLKALAKNEHSDALLAYLEGRLRLIQTVEPGRDQIRFAIDPLAEYLAGLYLVETLGEDEEGWNDFLEGARAVPGAPDSIKEFLLAVRECCTARQDYIHVPEFVTHQIGKLVGLDPEVVKRAQLEQRIRRLIGGLDVPEDEDRISAIQALGSIGPSAERSAPMLIRFFKEDKNNEVRFAAALALGRIGSLKDAIVLLTGALSDRDPDVRQSAAESLGVFGGAAFAAVPPLIQTLQDQYWPVAKSAAVALGNMGLEAGEATLPLIEMLRNKDEDVRRAAVDALIRIRPVGRKPVEALIDLLRRTKPGPQPADEESLTVEERHRIVSEALAKTAAERELRKAAGDVLTQIAPFAEEGILCLIEAWVGETEDEIREEVARAMAEIGPAHKELVPYLVAGLQSIQGKVRWASARLLRSIGPGAREAVPALITALRDDDEDISEAATLALQTIGPEGNHAVLLVEALRDERPHVRTAAVTVLSGMELGAREAVPLVALVLSGEKNFVRAGASILLKNARVTADAMPLIESLRNRRDFNRPMAREILMDFGRGEITTMPLLIRLLADDSHHVRSGAAKVLARIGPGAIDAVLPLTGALNDVDHDVRRVAAEALGSIGPDAHSALTPLVMALRDENAPVRDAVADALARIEPQAKEAIVPLIKALHDRHEYVRTAAAKALGTIGEATEEVVLPLVEALRDKDSGVSRAAADALIRIGPRALVAVDPLVQLLQTDSEYVRWAAAKILSNIGPGAKDAVLPLIAALSDLDHDVRRVAAEALGNIGPVTEYALTSLVAALRDENNHVRDAVADALERIGVRADKAIVPLTKALEDREDFVRRAAAKALGNIGPEASAAVPALVEALKDSDIGVSRSAAEALIKIGPRALVAVGSLIQLLKSDGGYVPCAATKILGSMGPSAEEAVPALIEALEAEDPNICEASAEALGRIRSGDQSKVVMSLAAALRHENVYVRRAAASALGSMGPKAEEAVQPLIQALRDSEQEVSRAVTDALIRIGPRALDAVGPLVQLLKDDSEYVRWAAANILGSIGPAAEDAVSALIEAQRDSSSNVRWTALRTLKVIQGSPIEFQP